MSKKIASIEKVAEELNKVMCYGLNEKGEVEDESEMIDLEMSDKALTKEIAKRAQEDLAPKDKEEFSPDVWEYFRQNDLLPEGCEDEEEEDAEEEEEAPKAKSKKAKKEEPEEEEEDEPEGEEEEEEKPSKKPKAKKEKAVKEKKEPREKGPSFEEVACRIVKSHKPEDCYEALMEEFTKLYAKRGKTDKEFIKSRVEIYYRIAAKRLGVECALTPKPKGGHKAVEKVKKSQRKDADGMDAPEEEEEAPKKAKKSKK